MRKNLVCIIVLLSIVVMASCAGKADDSESNQKDETNQLQDIEPANESGETSLKYTGEVSLNMINYTFHYPETESYTSATYGRSVGIGNSETIATVIYSPTSGDLVTKASSLDEAMDACEPYIAETIRDAIGDFTAEEDHSSFNKDIITTGNGIEMLKTTGVYIGEEYGNIEYTAYYFLDEDKPVYVLAYPKDGSGSKSSEPQFDYLVDQFVQHITKEG